MQGIHSKQSMDRHRLRTIIPEIILMTTARVCMFPRSLMHECIMALTHNVHSSLSHGAAYSSRQASQLFSSCNSVLAGFFGALLAATFR